MRVQLTSQSTANGLRIAPGEQQRILAELTVGEKPSRNGAERRRSERHPLPTGVIVKVSITQPGGTRQKFLVKPRNISQHGISFLNGAYAHLESTCIIELHLPENTVFAVEGKVVRCRYLRSTIHEVAVEFTKPIEWDAKAGRPNNANTENDGKMQLPQLDGRVLYVDRVDADRRMAGLLLTEMGLRFRAAMNTIEALKLASQMSFDLILADYRLKPDPATFLIRRLRSSGVQSPVIVLCHLPSPAIHQEIHQAGGQGMLPKPFPLNQLISMLSQHLKKDDGRGKRRHAAAQGIRSDLWNDKTFRPVILEFVHNLEAQAELLGRLVMEQSDHTEGREIAEELSASAKLYGYPKLSDAAAELAAQLYRNAGTDEITLQQVSIVEDIIRQIQAAC